MPEGNDMESQPLMGDNPPPATPDDGRPKPGEYVEMRKHCYCFSHKCEIIFAASLLIGILALQYLMDLAQASQNKYIDPIYVNVSLILILPFIVGSCIFFYYTCAAESHSTRSLIPWFYVLAGISIVLIFAWTMIYFATMYETDSVMKRILFEENEKRAYEKENKGWFFFMLVLVFLIDIFYAGLYWYITTEWIEKHKN